MDGIKKRFMDSQPDGWMDGWMDRPKWNLKQRARKKKVDTHFDLHLETGQYQSKFVPM